MSYSYTLSRTANAKDIKMLTLFQQDPWKVSVDCIFCAKHVLTFIIKLFHNKTRIAIILLIVHIFPRHFSSLFTLLGYILSTISIPFLYIHCFFLPEFFIAKYLVSEKNEFSFSPFSVENLFKSLAQLHGRSKLCSGTRALGISKKSC